MKDAISVVIIAVKVDTIVIPIIIQIMVKILPAKDLHKNKVKKLHFASSNMVKVQNLLRYFISISTHRNSKTNVNKL